jgi:hypothetical protein
MPALLEAIDEFTEAPAQDTASAGAAETAAQFAKHATEAKLTANSRLAASVQHLGVRKLQCPLLRVFSERFR